MNGFFGELILRREGVFQIDFKVVDKLEINVYNIFGQLVKNQSFIRNEKVIIDITNQPQGTYIMKISDEIKTENISFIKQ